MSEPSYPKSVAEVVATLTEIFRHQQKAEIVELLENSHARLDNTEFDNWNGGTWYWALRLEVPVVIFAAVEPRLAKIEQEIGEKLKHFSRSHPTDPLTEVTIAPIAPGAPITGQRVSPSDVEVRRLWPEGRFRLFLSHLSTQKAAVSKLKDDLALYGIAGFVAHADIEPSREWQKEIELGLNSMHALAALITPDFHASPWTEQEVGWAFGRGLLIVPVRLGADPCGFAAKVQGVNGDLANTKALAEAIMSVLLKNSQTHNAMCRAIAASFCKATSIVMAQALRKLIVKIPDFTDEEKKEMVNACTENKNISKAWNVPEAIYNAFGRPAESKAVAPEGDDVPF